MHTSSRSHPQTWGLQKSLITICISALVLLDTPLVTGEAHAKDPHWEIYATPQFDYVLNQLEGRHCPVHPVIAPAQTFFQTIRLCPNHPIEGASLLRDLHPWFSKSVGLIKVLFDNKFYWKIEPIPPYIINQITPKAYPSSGPTVHGIVSKSFWKDLVKLQNRKVQILVSDAPFSSSYNGAKTYVKRNTILIHLPSLHPATLAQEALRLKLYTAHLKAPTPHIDSVKPSCLKSLKSYFSTLYFTLFTTHLTQNPFQHFYFSPQILSPQNSSNYRTFLTPSSKYTLEYRVDGPIKKKVWEISKEGVCPQIFTDYAYAITQSVLNEGIVDRAAHLRILMESTEFLTLNFLHCQIFPRKNCFNELLLRSSVHGGQAENLKEAFHKELKEADARRLPSARREAFKFAFENPQEHHTLCHGSKSYQALFCQKDELYPSHGPQ